MPPAQFAPWGPAHVFSIFGFHGTALRLQIERAAVFELLSIKLESGPSAAPLDGQGCFIIVGGLTEHIVFKQTTADSESHLKPKPTTLYNGIRIATGPLSESAAQPS